MFLWEERAKQQAQEIAEKYGLQVVEGSMTWLPTIPNLGTEFDLKFLKDCGIRL